MKNQKAGIKVSLPTCSLKILSTRKGQPIGCPFLRGGNLIKILLHAFDGYGACTRRGNEIFT